MRKGTLSILAAALMVTSAFFGLFMAGAPIGAVEPEDPVPSDITERIEMPKSSYQHFTKNMGQWYTSYQYVGKTDLGQVGMAKDGVYFNVVKEVHDNAEHEAPTMIGHVLKLSFDDSNPLRPEGQQEIGAKYHYLIGDKSNWVTHVPNYNEVVYADVWDGIDVKYHYGGGEGLKYDIIVSPQASPSDIRMTMEGQKMLTIVGTSLVIDVDGEVQMTDSNLEAFYLDDPAEKIDVRFSLVDQDTYTFTLGKYDSTRAVVIDPLYLSTYMGGYTYDYGYGAGVDSDRNPFIMGYTRDSSSGNYPTTTGAYQTSITGNYDAFVSKFHYAGNELYYSTFVGGGGNEYCRAGTADPNGYAYITGYTYYYSSSMYPTTYGAYSRSFTYSSYPEIFVTKISQDGSSLSYSTYIGGAYYDYGYAIDVDSSGSAYVAGYSGYSSSYTPRYGEFPTTSGAYQGSRAGTGYNAVAFKFNPSGSALSFSTFLGGSANSDYAYGIASDSSGGAAVTGYTYSNNFPTTSGAYSTSLTGTRPDAWVA
ncbi:MAG: SBBP repeat-containing protein, partial [Thermoplasmatota archaeon]